MLAMMARAWEMPRVPNDGKLEREGYDKSKTNIVPTLWARIFQFEGITAFSSSVCFGRKPT